MEPELYEKYFSEFFTEFEGLRKFSSFGVLSFILCLGGNTSTSHLHGKPSLSFISLESWKYHTILCTNFYLQEHTLKHNLGLGEQLRKQ